MEFSVEGHLPGSQVAKEKDERINITAKAEAGFSSFKLGLEVARNGEVIASKPLENNLAEVDLNLLVASSGWYAARVRGDTRTSAHTTPIYVRVGDERTWNREKAGSLLEKRLRILDELERVIDSDPEAI